MYEVVLSTRSVSNMGMSSRFISLFAFTKQNRPNKYCLNLSVSVHYDSNLQAYNQFSRFGLTRLALKLLHINTFVVLVIHTSKQSKQHKTNIFQSPSSPRKKFISTLPSLSKQTYKGYQCLLCLLIPV